MAIDLDLDAARATLEGLFADVQAEILAGTIPPIEAALIPEFDQLFATNIQSYREGLLGLVLARLQSRAINVRLPYAQQGDNAFNGRTLDETVVNPFFQEHRIPSSRGPYLAMFRRDFRFEPAQRGGQRNKVVFDAFLVLITALEQIDDEEAISGFATYLLYRFAKLREAADVPLSRLQRISLEQYSTLLGSLLELHSGGRLPVVIVVAAFRTIKEFFGKDWEIAFQGINVADGPTGVGGDITVTENGRVVFAAEVTERPLERARRKGRSWVRIPPSAVGTATSRRRLHLPHV
jgi:hypothetical protein